MILRINIFITYRCNKTCYYCDIPGRKNNLDPDISLIEKYFPIINSGTFDTYTLTGGEPGLVDENILDYLFNQSKHLIKVNTNGVFFDKGYYEKYYDRITEVGYHTSIDPIDEININSLDEKVVIYQPITKQNFKDVEIQLKRYPNLTFNYIPYIRKQIFSGDEKFYMDQNDLKECQQILCNYSNVSIGSRERILKLSQISKEKEFQEKLLCQNSGTRFVVNFVDGIIHRCPESITHSDTKELNDENVNLMLREKLFEKSKTLNDVACQDCYYYPTFTPFNIRGALNGTYKTNLY